MTTPIEQTAFATLDQQDRFYNPVVKESGTREGRFVYRGELAVEHAQITEKERRPPTLLAQQVIAAAEAGKPALSLFAGYLLSFESLAAMNDVLAPVLDEHGTYFAFCSNIDLDEHYRVPMGKATWYVLPLDESSVYIELLELLDLEKSDLKKLSSAAKIDAIADAAKKFQKTRWEEISYATGLERMGPVKDPGENRPV